MPVITTVPVPVPIIVLRRPVVALSRPSARRHSHRATRRRERSLPLLALLFEFLEHVAQLMVPEMHLSAEMVCQAPIGVEHREIRAADVANTQLLVP